MADLVIRRADGWVEVTRHIQPMFQDDTISPRDLWEWAAQGNVKYLNNVLDFYREEDVCQELFDLIGPEPISGLFVVDIPDDLKKSNLRIWLRRTRGPMDWAPN